MSELPILSQGRNSGLSTAQLSQALAVEETLLRYRQAVASERFHKEINNKLAVERMEIVKSQAERAMENQETARVMSSLAGKFSLISKILQNIG